MKVVWLGIAAAVVVGHNALVFVDAHEAIYLSVHVAFVAGLLYVARDHWASWGVDLDRRRVAAASTMGAGVAFAALVPVAVAWAAGLLVDDRYWNVSALYVAGHVVTIVFGVVLVEEVLFRGWLLAATAGPTYGWRGVVWSSIAFGLWHLASEWERVDGSGWWWAKVLAGIVATGAAGVVLSWLRLRARHVVAPMIVHAAVNVGVFASVATLR